MPFCWNSLRMRLRDSGAVPMMAARSASRWMRYCGKLGLKPGNALSMAGVLFRAADETLNYPVGGL